MFASMKRYLVTLCALGMMGFGGVASAETLYPLPVSDGHKGEKPSIAYHIEYLSPLGVTTAGPTGITYAPYGYYPTFEPTVLPARYFRTYPLYFGGESFAFVVHLENTGKRTYRNLLVITAQEFLNTEGGAGVPFPGEAAHNWSVPKLGPGESIALSGAMTLPAFGSSGIDQTHLQILHWENDETELEDVGKGRVLLDDPQAGLWCPL
ncbi:MAG: hypothetical protein A3C93_02335 [Candidatus Lloydbacteria bacterium RIFCSPHIGHO2_02_FULL_54_17]|uniref:DUF11 domain-containing protein n=1 Tax=Candidatus Lloydbacteria bacterium RIFCSPHIGHO2_02_FULL_54_17 TaxID=1798664 RepID=A0A1G2DFM1_9BACT|nr:MAG: hypothetical protein A2762_04575 [Candidatus Lloydbacteria bacterium RIFCSPHIGHO2_01_FULL_54_11]OGZ11751.1 MAG: hypothetical protein A3C93_02335 [Candidatus Lloydbacteria bacterium RIFCSPHIGHO2_02_FULL_54_17]OGZ14280.1 MAG: hypothetical protein A2948_01670 [Candidatus Lloydbacteria bacterium RIFCSPLOWO2_01_FULL_54_18]